MTDTEEREVFCRLAHLNGMYARWHTAAPGMALGIAAEMIVECAEILELCGQGVAFDDIDAYGAFQETFPMHLGRAICSIEDSGILSGKHLVDGIAMWRDFYKDFPDWHEFLSGPGMQQRTGYHGLRDAVLAEYRRRATIIRTYQAVMK